MVSAGGLEGGGGQAHPEVIVDLYSDTQTRPTEGMRRAIYQAEVGDEQRGEDPTVNRLQEMTAARLGKEAALFLPSGTMCNEIAYRVWGKPGEEILLDRTAHALHFEAGGLAALSGLMARPLDGEDGVFTGEQLRAALRPRDDFHMQRNALVSIEQTSNLGGGKVWRLEQIQDVAEAARAAGLPLHMDGARLMNAAVAGNLPADDFAAPCQSVWIDLSKGLGCPVGAVLAGSADFIHQARHAKHLFGGAMRQAGIIAAAGVYALEHHVERLAEDHARAKRLAEGIAEIPGLALEHETVDTNIVYFRVDPAVMTADQLSAALLEGHGVRIGAMDAQTLRAVTHLDVSDEGIDMALVALSSAATT